MYISGTGTVVELIARRGRKDRPMKRALAVLILLAGSMAMPNTLACAQGDSVDSDLELLRADARAKKVELIKELIQLTEEESAAFWPVYKKYEAELKRIYDARSELIRDYVEHFDKLDDEKAKELVETSFELEEKMTSLKKQYFKEFEEVLPLVTVAKFFQLEHRINLMIDSEIASQLPLIY